MTALSMKTSEAEGHNAQSLGYRRILRDSRQEDYPSNRSDIWVEKRAELGRGEVDEAEVAQIRRERDRMRQRNSRLCRKFGLKSRRDRK